MNMVGIMKMEMGMGMEFKNGLRKMENSLNELCICYYKNEVYI